MNNVKYVVPSGRKVNFLVHSYTPPDGWNCDFVIRKNQLFDGNGYFEGNVKKDGISSGNVLLKVFDSDTGVLIREILTDNIGNYLIDGLNPVNTYDVVAYDIDGAWETKVFSKRTPAQ